MDVNQFAEWLDKYCAFDESPWIKWFDELYCKKCESIMCHYEDNKNEFPCSYCELEDKCRFFPDLDGVPDNKMIIKMWLESEVDDCLRLKLQYKQSKW